MGADILSNVNLIEEFVPQNPPALYRFGFRIDRPRSGKTARTTLRKYGGPFEINYISDISKEVLLEEVARLPENSAILYLAFTRDAKGATFVPREMLSDITAKANSPVFGIIDSYLGYGIVGGILLNAEVQGKRIADVAAHILRGELPVVCFPLSQSIMQCSTGAS